MTKRRHGPPPKRTNRFGKRSEAGSEPQGPPTPALKYPLRLNRFIARSGVCSRREADDLIREGKVKIAGEVVTDFSRQVKEHERVEVNGALITPVTGMYLLMNKPTGVITTNNDEKGRKTVLDLIDLEEERKAALFPVGRLDRETSGVLILTSDGELAHRLMHPSYEIEKLYRVRTKAAVEEDSLARLSAGIEMEDGPAKADWVGYSSPPAKNEVGIAVHIGRNRIVRRMFEMLGHEVEELERVRYAGLTTTGVRRGKWRRLEDQEIKKLYRAVKLKV